MPSAFLPDRAFVRIGGPDAEHFLQNLITTDLGALAADEWRPGALLTPQGKILFDFLISRDGDAFRIDIRADQLDAFVKRMTMYKLRAAVAIEVLPESGATVSWGEEATSPVDHRFALAGTTLSRQPGKVHEALDSAGYDALRVLHGVPDSVQTTSCRMPFRMMCCSTSRAASRSARAAMSVRKSCRACSTAPPRGGVW